MSIFPIYVSTLDVWMDATEEEERQHLLEWESQTLGAERVEGERLMQVEHDAEAEHRELEEEAAQRAAALVQQPPAASQQAEALAAYQQAFPRAQALEYVDLTNEDDDA